MNKKYQILKNDKIQVKHPGLRNKIITLFRIISLEEIIIKYDKEKFKKLGFSTSSLDKFPEEFVIPENTIGGYVESESNLDCYDNSWIGGNAKVFEGAFVGNGSYLFDKATILGNVVINNSFIGDVVRIQNGFGKYMEPRLLEKIEIINSTILDRSLIQETAKIDNCLMINSSRIYGETNIKNSYLEQGSYIFSSTVDNAILKDCSCIQVSQVVGTSLAGREAIVNNQRSNFTPDLQIIVSETKS